MEKLKNAQYSFYLLYKQINFAYAYNNKYIFSPLLSLSLSLSLSLTHNSLSSSFVLKWFALLVRQTHPLFIGKTFIFIRKKKSYDKSIIIVIVNVSLLLMTLTI